MSNGRRRTSEGAALWEKIRYYAIRDIDTGGGGGSSAGTAAVATHAHSEHSGLNADDHPGYLNVARGDARYYTETEVDSWRSTHVADTDIHHNQLHSIISASDHSVTGSQYDIVGLSANNTLGILSPSSDISGGNTILISSGAGAATLGDTTTGDLSVSTRLWINDGVPDEDIILRVKPNSGGRVAQVINAHASQSGDLWQVRDSTDTILVRVQSDGTMRSGDAAWDDRGWLIKWNGDAQFNDGGFRGEFHAGVLTFDETKVLSGRFLVTKSASAIYADVQCPGVGDGTNTFTLSVRSSPITGSLDSKLFEMNDILFIHGLGRDPGTAIEPLGDGTQWGNLSSTVSAPVIVDIWLEVFSAPTFATDAEGIDYESYTVKVKDGSKCQLRQGTAVANFGHRMSGFGGDYREPGHVAIDAVSKYGSPSVSVKVMDNDTPWTSPGFNSVVRMGKMRDEDYDSSLIVRGDKWEHVWGLWVGERSGSKELPHMIMSDKGIGAMNVRQLFKSSTSVTSGIIWPDGSFAFGEDLYNSDGEDHASFRFESTESGDWYAERIADMPYWNKQPISGYNGAKMGKGHIHIGNETNYLHWQQNNSELVIAGGPLQTHPNETKTMRGKDAGLYLSSNTVGHWNGFDWTTRIQSNGDFKFGHSPLDPSDAFDTSGSIEFTANTGILAGKNSSNETTWKAQIEDGGFYAGGDNVVMNEDGISLNSPVRATGSTSWAVRERLSFVKETKEIGYIGSRTYGTNDGDHQLQITAQGYEDGVWGNILIHAYRGGATYWPAYTTDSAGMILVTPEHVSLPSYGLTVGSATTTTTIPPGSIRLYENGDDTKWLELYVEYSGGNVQLKYTRSDGSSPGTIVS